MHISAKLHCLRPDREPYCVFIGYICSNCVVIVAMTTQRRNSLLLRRSHNIGDGVTFLYISPQPLLLS